jgi:ABC-type nitrate/sulfonate/bicarbonate transport system substrate-binding protein
MNPQLDRRTFLRRSAFTGAGLVALGPLAALVGCSSDSDSSSGTTAASGGSLGSIHSQLGWIKDVQFAGDYLADTKGYWTDQGLEVTIDAGGPNVASIPVVVAKKALVTQANPDAIGTAIAKGAALSIIGAKFQTAPYAITSAAGSPITTPQEMVGKKIGVQPNNDMVWDAFLEINDLAPDSIEKIVAGFDPSPLSNGEADGWLSFITDEPVTLAAAGFANYVMPFSEFGFNMIANCLTVRSDSLEGKEREQLVAFLHGLIMGWQDAIADPAEAVTVSLEDFGGDLDQDPDTAAKVLAANNSLMTDDGALTTGLYTISPERITTTIETVGDLGIELDESVFDLSLIEEVFDGATTLS